MDWSLIAREAITDGSKETDLIWNQAAAGSAVTHIPWGQFANTFWKIMACDPLDPKSHQRTQCIKAMLEIHVPSDSDTDIVQLQSYGNFTKIFTPLRTGRDGPAYIDDVVELCKKDWFYGPLTRKDADSILNTAYKSVNNGFLVRFSVTEVSFILCFIDSKKQSKECVHVKIIPDAYNNDGIQSFINYETKKKRSKISKGY